MVAAAYFVIGHILLVLAAGLLFLTSSIVKAPNKSIHTFYVVIAVLLLGLSTINTVMLVRLGGNVGTIDILSAAGPTILVIFLVFSIIKESIFK
ncbi:MAG TPA: hypothetical protein ENI80_10455 [Acidiferrobacteraceae bacterium]|nr:hypothetical protein [Acidiferrobacteraceae bacterium]